MPRIRLHNRDLPRLVPAIGAPQPARQLYPRATRTVNGKYHRVRSKLGNIRYSAANGTTPPFNNEVEVTKAGKDISPGIACASDGTLALVFARLRDSGTTVRDVFHTLSHDDGKTWKEPQIMFPGGKHPIVRDDPHGNALIFAAYVNGNIRCVIKGANQQPGQEFTFKDAVGNALHVTNDTFDLVVAPELSSRWVLAVVMRGEGEVSEWTSTDDGRTWKRYRD